MEQLLPPNKSHFDQSMRGEELYAELRQLRRGLIEPNQLVWSRVLGYGVGFLATRSQGFLLHADVFR